MIDEIDYKILNILQEKARIPNVEVARQVGMAPSAVLERIRKLERQGIIDGYEVKLNPEQCGRSLVAFLFVEPIRPHDETGVGRVLCEIQEVQEVHYLAGEDAYLVKVRVADPRGLSRLIRDEISVIQEVRRVRSSVALSTLKETSKIPLDALGTP